jgi:hypothetical protein
MARDESTGLHAAYTSAMGAYLRADPERRDGMFVGALCVELLRALGDPTCSYVVAGVACGEAASWDASARALCAHHAPIVDAARHRRRGTHL